MNIIEKEVLLLKSSDDNDKYETLLTKNGLSVQHLQILDFEYINQNLLKDKLKNVNIYDGIIFTSPRAVLALKKCLNNSEIVEIWKDKNNFVVGESTFDLAQKEIGLICKGKESGNANNLADLIINDSVKYKQFLFPCGNLKKETLGKCLKQHNIEVDSVIVYQTIKDSKLESNFQQITNNFSKISEFIVYFSPSGVKFTTNIFKENKVPFNKIKLIAIGPSTEEALNSENFDVFSVCLKPTENELLNAIFKKNENM